MTLRIATLSTSVIRNDRKPIEISIDWVGSGSRYPNKSAFEVFQTDPAGREKLGGYPTQAKALNRANRAFNALLKPLEN
jgi:hypothetical protein